MPVEVLMGAATRCVLVLSLSLSDTRFGLFWAVYNLLSPVLNNSCPPLFLQVTHLQESHPQQYWWAHNVVSQPFQRYRPAGSPAMDSLR